MSVLVESKMSDLNGSSKPLHPLFQKGPRPQSNISKEEEEGNRIPESCNPTPSNGPTKNESGRGSKRERKTGAGAISRIGSNSSTIVDEADSLDVDPNPSRRKKRKTASRGGSTASAEVEGMNEIDLDIEASGGAASISLPPRSAFSALSDNTSKGKQAKGTTLEEVKQRKGLAPLAESDILAGSSYLPPRPGFTNYLPNSFKAKQSKPSPQEESSQTVARTSSPTRSAFSVLSDNASKGKQAKAMPAEESDKSLWQSGVSSTGTDGERLRARSNNTPHPLSDTPAITGNFPNSSTPAIQQTSDEIIDLCTPSEEETDPSIAPAQKNPKKLLLLNSKTGTIGSPPAKSTAAVAKSKEKRPRKSVKQAQSKVVVVKYHGLNTTTTLSTGEAISRILSGTLKFDYLSSPRQLTQDKLRRAGVGGPSASNCMQPVHPLLLHKPSNPPGSSKESSLRKVAAVELEKAEVRGSPRTPRRGSDNKQTTGSEGSGTNPADAATPPTTNGEKPAKRTPRKAAPRVRRTPHKKPKPSNTTQTSEGSPKPRNAVPFKKSMFGASTANNMAKLLKFPGMAEPAWPSQGMVHVRGYDSHDVNVHSSASSATRLVKPESRRAKYNAVKVSGEDDIVQSIVRQLRPDDIAEAILNVNPDDFPTPPRCLRVPAKHHESGWKIQTRIRGQLQARISLAEEDASSEDEIRVTGKPKVPQVPPILSNLYASIATRSSAFDDGQCENQAWTQKYSPKSADEVLQTGREAQMLKEWLLSLTVHSTQFKAPDSRRSSISKGSKRKRTAKKLDGFVVDSDEELDDMDEISEPDEEDCVSGFPGLKRSIFKMGSPPSNIVLISGPNGCGKTAAAYAVANELGFEVFEINSGSVRSGRAIMDKVGNMTGNHLVSAAKALPEAIPQLDGAAEDRKKIDAAFAQDLQSGRQGTMNSFFTAKPETKPKEKPKDKPKAIPRDLPEPVQDRSAAPRRPDSFAKPDNFLRSKKEQKQSLILIEEADIIYKQDAGFWNTIKNLKLTSRRPIILTCNDEAPVLQNLGLESFHGILRFQPPPVEQAVDLLLLIAACEGHVLHRDAVVSMYEERGMDLRASLTNLNFWCQFAVGDVARGLGWYIPRSRGCKNVDEGGDPIRVVSEGTYQSGMGILSQDILKSSTNTLDIEEQTLQEAYEASSLDLGDWENTIGISRWANGIRVQTGRVNLGSLQEFEDYASHMADADLLSIDLFASENRIPLDPTHLPMLDKEYDEFPFVDEIRILDAPILTTYSTTGKDISTFIKSRIRNNFQKGQDVLPAPNPNLRPELSFPTESRILDLIVQSKTHPSHEKFLTRKHLSEAFDPISSLVPKYVWSTTPNLEPSQFDRPQRVIVEDLAPYVRGIVRSDAKLAEQRLKMSNLLSEGGNPAKLRRTRAAMNALEGGDRKMTRRERYFGDGLNAKLVARTGGEDWAAEE